MYPYLGIPNKSGELVVYVNGRVVSSVMTEGFDMDGDGTES